MAMEELGRRVRPLGRAGREYDSISYATARAPGIVNLMAYSLIRQIAVMSFSNTLYCIISLLVSLRLTKPFPWLVARVRVGCLEYLLALLHLRPQTLTLSPKLLLSLWQHFSFFLFDVVLHALHHVLKHPIALRTGKRICLQLADSVLHFAMVFKRFLDEAYSLLS